ncbi:MAG TPA: hypothetical protein EYP68_05810 [Candidatus Korarchaeota archaeon]|nr:hypothetical protein [Candidatus Korarchaeota archaeon]
MFKNKSKLGLALGAIVIIIVITLASVANEKPKKDLINKPTLNNSLRIPITERSFKIGVVPTPRNFPRFSQKDLTAAYEEASELGEIIPIWVNPCSIGALERLQENQVVEMVRKFGALPLIHMNFYKVAFVGGGKGLGLVVDAPYDTNLSDPRFRQEWKSEAVAIAAIYKPEYMSLGNEVNAWYIFNPESFDDYVSLYKETYNAIKEVSPRTKVFVTFSYEQLLYGIGNLSSDLPHWFLIEKFMPKLDLLAFTTYPWKIFDKPADIPDDYYRRISYHVSVPVAFTEIGWASSSDKFEVSEEEQARFLIRFLNLTKDMDLEFVLWLFLHEMEAEGTSKEAGSIALKRSDGSEKPVFNIWLQLKKLSYDEGP